MRTTQKLSRKRNVKTPILLSFLSLLGAFATAPKTADAAPSAPQAASAFRIPARPFAELRRDVAKARAVDPAPFATVTSLVGLAPEADARARGRKAPIALQLAKLGPTALMPMLEMLALDPPRGIPADRAPALRRDLIEAVGILRDARGFPVLSAILDDPSEDTETTRTVTEAIARIGTEEAATRILTALDGARGDRARAIVAGMGECRKLRVTEALAARIRTTDDEATARVAARALGRAGNAWVWQTIADKSEQARIRQTAARALVDAFVRHGGEARDAASNALMVVDAAETASLIADARKTSAPEVAKALDALAARFANNPSRTR